MSAKPTLSCRHAFLDSELGRLLALASPRGLRALRVVAPGQDARALAEESTRHAAVPVEDPRLARELRDHFADLLAGREPDATLTLDLVGTTFQKAVWRAVRRIPYGQTRTYGEIARAVGSPAAVRAVGQACGANPVAVVVPCHRVLRKGGGPGGYYWGLDLKQVLLDRERRTAAAGSQS